MKLTILKYGIVAAVIAGIAVLGLSKLEGYVDSRVQHYLDANPAQVYTATSKGIDLLKEAEKVTKGKFVKSLKDPIEQDSSDPVLGNPDADVTVVMFSARLSSQQDILNIIESLEIDSAEFLNELPKPYYAQKLDENLSLGEKLQIHGTPAFVVNGEVYPGVLSPEELLKIVTHARNSSAS